MAISRKEIATAKAPRRLRNLTEIRIQVIKSRSSQNVDTVWINNAFKKLMRLTGLPVSLEWLQEELFSLCVPQVSRAWRKA
jgi:hypothetical protein